MGMIPMVLHESGVAKMGLWTLIVQFTAYLSLVDSGVTSACIRRFVGPIARKEETGDFPVMFQAACVVSFFQGSLCCFLIFFVPFLASVLKVPSAMQGSFVEVLAFQFFLTGLCFLLRPFTALLLAAQRFEFNNLVSALSSLLSLPLLWFCLSHGIGIWSLAVVSLFQQFTAAACTVYMVRRINLIPMDWRPWSAPWDRIRLLFRDSMDFFSWSGFTTLNSGLQSVFLSRFLGLETVALWNVGTKTATLFYMLVSGFFNNAFPSLAEFLELGQARKCLAVSRQILRSSFLGAVGFGVAYSFGNGWFVDVWTSGLMQFPLSLSLSMAAWVLLATVSRAFACFSNVWQQRASMRRGPMVESAFFLLGLVGGALRPTPQSLAFALILSQAASLVLIYGPFWKKISTSVP